MKIKHILLVAMMACCLSCTKDFLEKKSDQSLLIPKSLNELQMLLDNIDVNNSTPGLCEIASDDFYMNAEALQSYTKTERGAYTWQRDLYESGFSGDWNYMFRQIFYTNVVLEQLSENEINNRNNIQYNQIKGAALFYRAWAYFYLAQEFMAPYNKLKAKDLQGFPIKIKGDINDLPPFSSMDEVYNQMISDLNISIALLTTDNTHKNRPSKQAALGLMARLYLVMENYDMAEVTCSAYLSINSNLIDFNNLNPDAARPLPSVVLNDNVEGVFYGRILSYAFLSSPLLFVDPELYKSYNDGDLRKICYFKDRGNNNYTFKGSYTASATGYTGIATDEVLITRAECRVRNGLISDGISDLNTLLEKRWDKNIYKPSEESNQQLALSLILKERRKELVFRGIRWFDLRRLNKDPRFAVTITRNLDNLIYTLNPNDNGYIFPVPESEIIR